MAYQIRYTETTISKKNIHNKQWAIKWIAACVTVAALGWLLHQDKIQNALIPGDPEITKAAFSSFTEDLKDGARFGEAAAAFCRQIIESDIIE